MWKSRTRECVGPAPSGLHAPVPFWLCNSLLGAISSYALHNPLHCTCAPPSCSAHFHHTAFFIGANVRAAVAAGRASYVPVFLHEVPQLVRGSEGVGGVDVALIQVRRGGAGLCVCMPSVHAPALPGSCMALSHNPPSPPLQVSKPDTHGFVSLGVSVDVVHAACQAAHTVLAEVNPRMPRTHGDTFVPVEAIDYFVENDRWVCMGCVYLCVCACGRSQRRLWICVSVGSVAVDELSDHLLASERPPPPYAAARCPSWRPGRRTRCPRPSPATWRRSSPTAPACRWGSARSRTLSPRVRRALAGLGSPLRDAAVRCQTCGDALQCKLRLPTPHPRLCSPV